jgi:hypothetical protein
MSARSGFKIVRQTEIQWEDRKNVDGWPSRAGMYYDDRENELCMRLIDYPVGSIEPRHVHAGAHATTVLRHTAIVDGLTLGPLDVVVGPSNEPHGPLDYRRDGCKLFSAFVGSYYHSEVAQLSSTKHYRLVQSAKIPWRDAGTDGMEAKTLVDHGVGRLLLQALRFAPGAKLAHPPMLAALVVEGSAIIEDEKLGEWDFFYVPRGAEHGTISFADGATLLAVSMR